MQTHTTLSPLSPRHTHTHSGTHTLSQTHTNTHFFSYPHMRSLCVGLQQGRLRFRGVGRGHWTKEKSKKINWRTPNKMLADWPGQLSQQGNNFFFPLRLQTLIKYESSVKAQTWILPFKKQVTTYRRIKPDFCGGKKWKLKNFLRILRIAIPHARFWDHWLMFRTNKLIASKRHLNTLLLFVLLICGSKS